LREFRESQVFRIDHYLGKETVQNVLAFRFANTFFEPIWNRNYIDFVQITAAEDLGIGTRAGYYDESGALRDLIQNHMSQLLALLCMEVPASTGGNPLRIRPVNMEFHYGTTFLSQSPEAYERLILDAMRGDASLFTRNDEVEAQWSIYDPVLEAWHNSSESPAEYPAGTDGPTEAI